MEVTQMPDIDSIEMALRCAAGGISVVPIECDGTKQPKAGLAWKHLQSRIASEAEIRRIFPGHGVASIGGAVSGNLEILDIDDPQLVEPFEAAVEEILPGLIGRLSVVQTPRQDNHGKHGWHARYRIEGAVAGNTKLAQSELRPQFNPDGTLQIEPKTGKQKLAPETLIETRGEGGYALLPGSPPECHVTGRTYEHVAGPPPWQPPLITAAEHRIILHVARSFNRYVAENDVTRGPAQQRGGLSPGDDFNTRASWDDVLAPLGWTKHRVVGDVIHWCRPGKSTGTSATTGVKSTGGTELLCCFSTNAFPFEGPYNGRSCSSYSKFAAYAVLNHNGDFKAAAKALVAQGYGEPQQKQNAFPQTGVATPVRGLSLSQPFRPFPVSVLPSTCADFIRQKAASIDCDESMIALPVLAASAASIGNSCRIQLKGDYSEPATLWAAMVCESGTRKSAALESPLASIRRREGEEIKKFNRDMEEYLLEMQKFKASSSKRKRKLAEDEGESITSEPERPIGRRFTVSDVTSEALAVRLEQNPRGLLSVRDELSGFFTGLNQYKAGGKGGDEAAYLAMHGARPLMIDRKNPEKPTIHVPMANLSIVGSIQPAILRRMFTRDRMESGMAARFLLSYPPTRAVKWCELSVDPSLEDRLGLMFDWLLSLPVNINQLSNEIEPARLRLSSDAKELWVAFHDEHCDEQSQLHGDLSAAWAKLTGYAARLSLVCELMAWATGDNWDRPTFISTRSVQAGIALARWFSAETKRIYEILGETEDERDLRELRDYISRRGGSTTVRELVRGPRRYRDNEQLAEVDLQRLAAAGTGHWEHQPSGNVGGRPTDVFRLNQSFLGDKTQSAISKLEGSVANSGNVESENGDGEWAA